MWTVVVVLLALWLVLVIAQTTFGGWAHGFLIGSIILGLWQILRGRRVA